ncbi:MAG TPA: ECF subfamily RNA polymerase sigma factor, BldN family [Frankiaceae bacterium]|nr:ECF subfamily RNA polymerase sigma factor, BldN family [Frankiaceae bacterium]
MTRPHGRLSGFDALRAELVRYHTDPHAFGDGTLGVPRGSLGNVIPLRPELAGAVPAPADEHAAAAEDAAPEGDEPFEAEPAVVELVARAQGGDAEAFGLLYDRYLDLVYRYVYYRVGSKALAEDLVSETFLRALRRIGSFEWQGRDFAAWLVTIARNIVADHYKSGRFRLEVSTADMLDADRATDGPENEVLEGITNVTLLEAVKRLNGEQQECVVLRFLQGMSVLETAQAMGKTEGAIKALQYRAVRTLGRMLPKELVL